MMASTLFRALIPGVAVVVGGSALALVLTQGPLATDLETRSVAALSSTEFGWASIAIEGRDAVISGTATTQQAIDDAVMRVGAVSGVRAVRSATVLAEVVSPFPFAASIVDGKITLTGGYPSEAVHSELVAVVPGATDTTRLLSGAPNPAAFAAGARFALDALNHFDQGDVQLADLSLTITGRANSPQDFDSLNMMAGKVPEGIKLAALKVTPPLASPYVWTAHFDGKTIAVSGNTPTPELGARLRDAAPAGITVGTSLVLASGEPSGFESKILTLFKTLLLLESGDVTFSDGEITLTGAPETSAIADRVVGAVASIGGTSALEPPRVTAYALRIDKRADALVFSGFVPDAPTRARIAAVPGADVSAIELGRGAPERFDSGVDFGVALLSKLAEGRFSLDAEQLGISGRAGTVADFKAAVAMIAEGAPQGLALATADVRPPVANPFLFSAVKADDGRISLSGFVPDEPTRAALHAGVATLAADTADPADGAPDNFAASAGKGLEILALLDSGTLAYDGSRWSLDGFASDTRKSFAADAAYSIAGLRTAGWSYTVRLPEAPAAVALPIIAPYVWRAAKAADGSVSFTGFAPAEAFQRVARGRAAGVADATVLGAGAPPDFGTSALAGLDALLALEEGSLGLAGTRWTLTGETADLATRKAIQDTLSGKVDAANWQIAIQARDATPVVTPYLWAATKASDGVIELSGYLPDEELKALAASRAGTVSRDDSTVASGEPAGFADDLAAGLDALIHLAEGKAQFDGSKWILTGTAATQADGEAAVAALLKGSKAGAMWTTAINGYAAPSPVSSEPSSSQPPSSEPPSSEPVTSEPSSSEPSSQPPSSASEAPSSEPSSASEPPASSSEAPAAAASDPSSSAPAEASSTEPDVSSEVPDAFSSSSPFPETPFMEPKPESSSSAVLEPSSAEPAAPSSSLEPTSAAPVELPSSQEPEATAIVVTPKLPAAFVFEANRAHRGPIALKGAVPAEAAAAYFGSIAGGVPTDALVVTPGMAPEFITDALGGIDALTRLTEGRLGYDGARWWLRGKAETAAVRDAVTAAIAALPGEPDWSLGIDLLAPIELCTDKVSEVAGRNAILFTSGSATLTEESLPVLDELAADLAICPKTFVHVEGHTDADGPEDVNLALSVARAEVVVAGLIERGVSEERLYAEGYGESVPIASNETRDGKQQNRRIAFTISPE